MKEEELFEKGLEEDMDEANPDGLLSATRVESGARVLSEEEEQLIMKENENMSLINNS